MMVGMEGRRGTSQGRNRAGALTLGLPPSIPWVAPLPVFPSLYDCAMALTPLTGSVLPSTTHRPEGRMLHLCSTQEV
jgi:hypothetical protein